MARDWMNKWESNEDERWEKSLKEEIEQYIDKFDIIKASSKPIDYIELKNLIEKIVDKYHIMKVHSMEYDEEQYNYFLKELEMVKYKLLEEKHNNDKDTKSWEEYREEEQIKTKREEEDQER